MPIGAAALVAFVAGALVGGGGDRSAAVERFAAAWEAGDTSAMHAELTPAAQRDYPLEEFEQAYADAGATATATDVELAEPAEAGEGREALDATVATRAFGSVSGTVELPLDDEGRVEWEPHLAFPGLEPGEDLERETRLGRRAPLLAADGTPLAEGPPEARTSPLGASALAIAGELGTPERALERELYALGFPAGAPAGTSGLELAFNERLAGKPGGELLAVPDGGGEARVLAESEPRPGKPVETTIDPAVQEAAVVALGGQFGGLAVLDARSGDVLGVAGLAFSAPQPPGSTFKVVTATAALDAGVVEPSDEFPVEVSNSLIGREIANSNDSPCGGTFVQSFANSCNTVFAPLGVEVGAEKLLDTAERFGFNSPPALAAEEPLAALDPPASTIPPIEGDVALGESAIGQGQVLATPLQMASVAQTIANGGRRSPTSIARTRSLRPDAEPVEVTSRKTAETIRSMMEEVVRSGTGTAAAVPGVTVAGKTGTAELGPAALPPGEELAPGEDPPQEKNAWFLAFAPAEKPRYALAVMLVEASGDGGEVAAPIAQQVLATLLG